MFTALLPNAHLKCYSYHACTSVEVVEVGMQQCTIWNQTQHKVENGHKYAANNKQFNDTFPW